MDKLKPMTKASVGKNVLILSGGTGGHVFPAIAVAQELKERGCRVLWIGTEKGIESRVVPENDIQIKFISTIGVRGKNISTLIKAPFIMFKGLLQSLSIIKQFKPVSVLGMGGFVSLPGGVASFLLRKPLVLHEQNAVAGTANRLLSHFACRALEGFSNAFPAGGRVQGESVGNPVRQEIVSLAKEEKNVSAERKINLLVVGGSLGALAINKTCPDVFLNLADNCPNVWHQTGQFSYEQTLALYTKNGVAVNEGSETSIRVSAFIDDMAAAYRWADLVLCRAGAITLAEISCAKLPAIFIPLPHAIDDHQTKNAQYFSEQGSAILLKQAELNTESLSKILSTLIEDRNKLSAMSKQAELLARPTAAQAVADICLEVACG